MKKLILIMIAMMMFLLSACSNTNDNKENREEVSLMLDWYPNAVHSFLYVAIEKGYFKERGINLSIQYPANPSDPLTLAAAGKVKVGIYYQQDTMLARLNEEIPVQSIGPIVRTPLSQIMTLKQSELNRPRDLEGKTVGYSSTLLREVTVKAMVEADGGDASKVKLIDVGFDLVTALVTEKVDAIAGGLINHELPIMEYQGFEISVMNPVDYGVPQTRELVFVAADQTIEKDKELLKEFLKAAEKGYRYTKENPEEALDILLENQEKASFPLTKAIEEKSLSIVTEQMEFENEPFLSENGEGWSQQNDWLMKEGISFKNLPPQAFFEKVIEP